MPLTPSLVAAASAMCQSAPATTSVRWSMPFAAMVASPQQQQRVVRNVVDGLGDNVLTGAVGGGGLLAGTPVDGLQGDGALVSSSLLGGDDSSSPSSLVALGAGTDQSQGLVNVTRPAIAADRARDDRAGMTGRYQYRPELVG